MLYLCQWLICRPLRSTHFHELHRYYEAIRLLTGRRASLSFIDLAQHYPFGSLSDLPGTLEFLSLEFATEEARSPGRAFF